MNQHASIQPAATDPEAGLILVSLQQLQPSGANPRKSFDQEAIAELAASIREQGLLQNLLVKPAGDGRYAIVSGERRFRALSLLASKADWPDRVANIPVKVVAGDDAAAQLAIALIENLQRQDVNPMEEALALRQLQRMDPKTWTTENIARAIGCKIRRVQQLLQLTEKLEPDSQTALREGRINFSQARIIAMAAGKKQKELLKEAIDGHDRAALERELRHGMIPVGKAIFDVGKSGLELVELQKGKLYFRNREAFLQAQHAAARAKAAELRRQWAWARIHKGYFYSGNFASSTDRKKAGCIIEIDEYWGDVKIHTGLVEKPRRGRDGKPAPKNETPDQKKARLEEERQAKAREKAAAACTKDLQAAVVKAPAMAVRLLVFDALTGMCDNAWYLGGLDLPYDAFTAGPASITAIRPMLEKIHGRDAILKRNADPDELWRRLLKVTDGQLLGLLARTCSAQAQVSDDPRSQPPALKSIAASFGVTVPEILLPEPEDRKHSKKGKR